MTQKEYIETFVTNFISVWTANNFDEYCALGKHKELQNPPIEDAIFLAERTWEKFHIHMKGV